MCEICDKNISKEKHEKLRNYLFKIKELNKIVPGKWLFASIKGQLYLTKEHLGNQQGQKERVPPHQKFFFNTFDSNSEVFFKKRHFLTKRPIPGCFTFLK